MSILARKISDTKESRRGGPKRAKGEFGELYRTTTKVVIANQ